VIMNPVSMAYKPSMICSARLFFSLAALHLLLPVQTSNGQEIGFVFASDNDQRVQAFARRGVAIDVLSDMNHIRIEADNRSLEVFREVAPPVLVRTYDSLQVGSMLRTQIDRILQISGDKLESVDFVLIDDEDGYDPDDVGGLTSIEEGGKRYAWPATNIVGWYDREVTTYVPGEPEDEGLTIVALDETSPEEEASIMDEEAVFLDETADLLESLYADASAKLAGLNRSIGRSGVEAAKQQAVVDGLAAERDAMGELVVELAAKKAKNDSIKVSLEALRAIAIGTAGRIPIWVPDLEDYTQALGDHMDELYNLSRDTRLAGEVLQPINDRLHALSVSRSRILNEMERWKREAASDRKRAEILRRRANGVRSGELHLDDYRTGTETSEVVKGWSYEADVILGSTLAERFISDFGGWDAWEGIILHRTLNSQFLSASLIRGRRQTDGPDRVPLFKAGWSEVALFGTKFDEADLSTLPHQAVETGIGLFLAARHSAELRKRLNRFFDGTGPKYVFPKGRAINFEMPDEFAGRYAAGYSDLEGLEGEVGHQVPWVTGTVEVGKLRWEDVPPEYLLRSSSTVAGFLLLLTAGWSDDAIMMDPVYAFATDTWDDLVERDLTVLVRQLSAALEETSSQWTIRGQSVSASAGLMPMAYLDILTNFGLSRADVFPASDQGSKKPRMLNEYWALIRPALRLGLDAHGLHLGGTNSAKIAETTDKFLVCAVKFVGDQGGDTAEGLLETCWPGEQDGK